MRPSGPLKCPTLVYSPMGYSSMTRTSFWGMGARGGPEVTGVHALGPEGEEQAVIRLVMRQKAGLKKGAFMVVLPSIIGRRHKNATVNFVAVMKDLDHDTLRSSFNAIGVVFFRDGGRITARAAARKDMLAEYSHDGMIAHFDNGIVVAGRQGDGRRNVFGTHGQNYRWRLKTMSNLKCGMGARPKHRRISPCVPSFPAFPE